MELFAIKSHLIHLICHATVIPFESNFLSLEGIQKFNYQLKFFNLTQMKLLYFLKHTAPKILMHFYELFVCVCVSDILFWHACVAQTSTIISRCLITLNWTWKKNTLNMSAKCIMITSSSWFFRLLHNFINYDSLGWLVLVSPLTT